MTIIPQKRFFPFSLRFLGLLLFCLLLSAFFIDMSSAGNHHRHHHDEQQPLEQQQPWSRLVGKHKDEVVESIRKENPTANIQVVPKVIFFIRFCVGKFSNSLLSM
jgi:hypothetical protein